MAVIQARDTDIKIFFFFFLNPILHNVSQTLKKQSRLTFMEHFKVWEQLTITALLSVHRACQLE